MKDREGPRLRQTSQAAFAASNFELTNKWKLQKRVYLTQKRVRTAWLSAKSATHKNRNWILNKKDSFHLSLGPDTLETHQLGCHPV